MIPDPITELVLTIEAVAPAAKRGEDVSAVVRAALTRYVKRGSK